MADTPDIETNRFTMRKLVRADAAALLPTLTDNDVVMLDLGCMFEGYHSDFARSVIVGPGPASAEKKAAYQASKAALEAMVAAITPPISWLALT